MSLAKVTVIGRLGRDPEPRITPSGANSIQFSVAASRRWRDRDGTDRENTTWFRVTCWGKLADTLTSLQGLRKGAQVYVEGRIETREYTASDGQLRTSIDVNANEVQLLGAREDRRDDAREAVRAGAYSVDENMTGVPF